MSNSRRYGRCEAQPSFFRVPALTLLDIHCTVHAAVGGRKRERESSTTQQATAVVGGRTHNNRCCQLHPRQQTSQPIVTCAATAYRVHTYLSGYLPDNHSITGLAFQGCAALRPTAASNTQVFIIWTRTVLNRSRQKRGPRPRQSSQVSLGKRAALFISNVHHSPSARSLTLLSVRFLVLWLWLHLSGSLARSCSGQASHLPARIPLLISVRRLHW